MTDFKKLKSRLRKVDGEWIFKWLWMDGEELITDKVVFKNIHQSPSGKYVKPSRKQWSKRKVIKSITESFSESLKY